MTEEYKNYIANHPKLWKDRFTWIRKNKNPNPTLSIVNFAKDGGLDSLISSLQNEKILNTNDLFKEINSLSSSYFNWCKKNYTSSLTEEDETSLMNFFKGALGEFFFIIFLNDTKTVISSNKRFYKFSNVCLPPSSYKDNGIDVLCTISNLSTGDVTHKAVIQCKFWSPYSKEVLTESLVMKMDSAGGRKKFIDPIDEDIFIFMWLGTEKKISIEFKNSEYYKQSVFIDKKSFDLHVNNKNTEFWKEVLPDKLSNICNL